MIDYKLLKENNINPQSFKKVKSAIIVNDEYVLKENTGNRVFSYLDARNFNYYPSNKVLSDKYVLYEYLKDYDILTCVRKYDDRDVFKTIVHTFFNTPDYSAKVSKNPYIAIYELNIKSQLKVVAPDVYEKFMPYIDSNNITIDDESIAIYLSNSREYEAFDEEFANNKAFVDYIVSESVFNISS